VTVFAGDLVDDLDQAEVLDTWIPWWCSQSLPNRPSVAAYWLNDSTPQSLRMLAAVSSLRTSPPVATIRG
jgi:hypothetical protein